MRRTRTSLASYKCAGLTPLLLGAVAAASLLPSPAMAGEPNPPNIVVVLADDLGIGDVHCYDPQRSKIPTPNIDRLARQGMMFTDAHAPCSVCTPSRYGLLTGRYPWRNGFSSVAPPYADPVIAADRLTLPALLKQHGYHTACIGKWHLGWDWPKREGKPIFDQPIAGGPTARGFDTYFGTDVPNYPPYTFIENDRVTIQPTDHFAKNKEMNLGYEGAMAPGWRFDQILPTLAQKAVSYIDGQAKSKEPFFFYFALTTPHEPIAPSKEFEGKSGISGVGDLIMETDWALGQMMEALARNGLEKNTLLIFTSDNGHCPYTGIEPFLKVGHRVSGPYRGYKGDILEGGHRMPFIARWPGAIKAGSRCGETVNLTDLMATCAELVGAKLPDTAGEDSVSILPLLKGSNQPVREASVYVSGGGVLAIFQGPWKLEFCSGPGGPWTKEPPPPTDAPTIQLYNLVEDPGEMYNLQGQRPEIVKQLTELLEKYIAEGRSTPGAPQKNGRPKIAIKRIAR